MLRNKTLRKCYSFSRQIVKQEMIRRHSFRNEICPLSRKANDV